MSAPLLAATVWLLVVLWVLVLLPYRAQRRRLVAQRQELAALHTKLVQAQAVLRRSPAALDDEHAEREYRRLMAEYEAGYERLRADCAKQGLHLPERTWRSR